eukprot:Transcript_10804.p1 GENE.Transcript_10804~~Transcript_10804.p1  ORF type:complete len:141 (-),score=31.86 Transcript_10804:327-695(-)
MMQPALPVAMARPFSYAGASGASESSCAAAAACAHGGSGGGAGQMAPVAHELPAAGGGAATPGALAAAAYHQQALVAGAAPLGVCPPAPGACPAPPFGVGGDDGVDDAACDIDMDFLIEGID